MFLCVASASAIVLRSSPVQAWKRPRNLNDYGGLLWIQWDSNPWPHETMPGRCQLRRKRGNEASLEGNPDASTNFAADYSSSFACRRAFSDRPGEQVNEFRGGVLQPRVWIVTDHLVGLLYELQVIGKCEPASSLPGPCQGIRTHPARN